jgi:hypothetical protein
MRAGDRSDHIDRNSHAPDHRFMTARAPLFLFENSPDLFVSCLGNPAQVCVALSHPSDSNVALEQHL